MGLFGEVAAISKEYIARISYGKDSLKMLEVIHSRGLPLDRITTTDVWATDTISANLPPMEEFKARMDERIWQLYRIQVEHLCARNKDGSKRTYEKMFYHVPVRRSQNVQVEREPVQARRSSGLPRPVEPVVSGWTQAECQAIGCRERSPASHRTPDTTGARNSSTFGCRIQGFPVRKSPWCRKTKIDYVKTPAFPMSPPRRAGI